MRLSNTVVAVCWICLSTFTEGHGGLPQLLSSRSVEDLKSRNAFGASRKEARHARPGLNKRQIGGADGQCGPGFGSCAAGYCCSGAGWCGSTPDYCNAPDCLFNYGSGCDTLKIPPGPSTNNVARTKLGSVPYGGVGIYQCTKVGTVALTYDDGPYIYTNDLLNLFASYNAKATFFITGNNNGKGRIDDASLAWPAVIRRMYSDGHQIASHTWGHQDLSAITQAQRLDQMRYNEIAMNNILGFFPTYMRPPYSSCTGACETDMATLGYHIIYFDLDTEDYLHDDVNEIQISKNDFSGNLSTRAPATGDFLAISHDIHYQTVYNLTQFMLDTIVAKGWKPVTVGECLEDPVANWYRKGPNGGSSSSGSSSRTATTSSTRPTSVSTTRSSSSSPGSSAPSALPVSTDATCGATARKTCLGSAFGNCCSTNGWCGSTTAYCGTGCQSGYGTCGSNSVSSASTRISSKAASSVSSRIVVVSQSSSKVSSQAAASSSAAAKAVSTDGSCGGNAGYTCAGSTFGSCCSQYGWCGSTAAYCGTACNSAFGTCSNTA